MKCQRNLFWSIDFVRSIALLDIFICDRKKNLPKWNGKKVHGICSCISSAIEPNNKPRYVYQNWKYPKHVIFDKRAWARWLYSFFLFCFLFVPVGEFSIDTTLIKLNRQIFNGQVYFGINGVSPETNLSFSFEEYFPIEIYLLSKKSSIDRLAFYCCW